MNRLTSKLNPTDATEECHPDIFKSDSLKVPKLLVRFSLRAANSLATSIRRSLSVLCLWVLSIVRLLNLVRVIVERSHVFSLSLSLLKLCNVLFCKRQTWFTKVKKKNCDLISQKSGGGGGGLKPP